jgi:site-specific DNA recombinase
MHDQRNAAGYVRVSTDEQTRGFSLGAQEEAIRERAARDGVALDDERVYIDAGISGARSDRPAYQAMLAAAAAGEFDVLYVWKFDRLGRDAEELLRARRMLEAVDVSIVSLTEGEAESTLMYGVRALVAQEEREKIAERTKLGVRTRVARGGYHGGRAPFGYRYRDERVEGDRTVRSGPIVVVPDEATIVRRVFGEFLGGAGVRRIAFDFNADGVKPPRAAAWDGSTISNVLRNPAYIGCVRMNGDVFAGEHESIVDERTWNEAQQLRESRRKQHGGGVGRNPAGRHLLTKGLLRCGLCGGAMRPRTYRHRDLSVYLCTTRDAQGGSGRCSMRPIERALVDEVLLEHFEEVSLDLDATRAQLTAGVERALAEAAARREAAEREVMLANGRIARVRRAFQDGKLDADDWREQRVELEAEQAAAEGELARCVQREREVVESARALDAEAELVRRLAELREAVAGRIVGSGDIDALRAAFTTVFSHVDLVVSDDGERDLVPHVRTDPSWTPTEREAEVLRAAAAGGPIKGYLPGNRRKAVLQLPPDDNVKITSALSAGTNDLLKLGASPLTQAADVLSCFGLEAAAKSSAATSALLELLPATADELVRRTGLSSAEVARELVELELAGLAHGVDGVYRAAP